MIDKKQYFKNYYKLNKIELKHNISQWQKENKQKVNEYKRKNKAANKKILLDYILDFKHMHPCQCGETYHKCLDFHHLKDKVACIPKLLSNSVKLDTLKKEIEKCNVVCSNCHRKLHCKSTPINRMLKFKYAYNYKLLHGCQFCSETHYACLDFHHLRDKIDTIGNMTKQKKYTLQDIKSEIQKCISICSNCHRKLHGGLLIL